MTHKNILKILFLSSVVVRLGRVVAVGVFLAPLVAVTRLLVFGKLYFALLAPLLVAIIIFFIFFLRF